MQGRKRCVILAPFLGQNLLEIEQVMRKIALAALMVISTLSYLTVSRFGYCEDEAVVEKTPAQKLINLQSAHNEDRIRDLEMRIDDLERERRFQDERIRNVERTVNDLRRER